jgi:hypothetical protein
MLLDLKYALKDQVSKMWAELDSVMRPTFCVHDIEVNDSW